MKKKNLFKALAIALSLSVVTPLVPSMKAYATTEAPEIMGESAVTMDIETGEIIYSKNADIKLSPASTTKLMTALLFAENKSKSDLIPFTKNVLNVTETALNNFVNIKEGDTMTADDIMKAVMIYSANDTAYLMAESVGGTIDTFVSSMNEKAKELGLQNTTFTNPSGLEIDPLNPSNKSYNQTTAFELAIIAKEAFKNDWLREAMAPKVGQIPISISGDVVLIDSRNKLLGKNGNIGGKTGTEVQAGHCFVGFYERDGRDLITVVLKSDYGVDGLNVFKDTESIANYGYIAEKQLYKSKGEEVSETTLTYKSFKFFGQEKEITVPFILNKDINFYQNDFNDKNASISYSGKVKDAWKLSGKDDINLTFTTPGHSEEVAATIKLSKLDLIKANLPIYLLSLLIVIIVISLIIVIIRIINIGKRKGRRGRRRRY
ncbi:serine hydrolase [Clostridium sp.]|uniref:D-alanyl-D-alanine carboxypeptidase family protein n=1 Tax=Clostridium sp. TaxID=1506 RepID=UPI00261FA25D|nr:serine hydrolase [Clostridium sp.]